MKTTANIALTLVRITGVIQIILGVLFWTGNAGFLVPVHMGSGVILVLALWVLAFLGIQSGANPQLGIAAIVWGLITVALGMTQDQILPGAGHWVIQVLHLLVGIGAIGMAHGLARGVTEQRAARAA